MLQAGKLKSGGCWDEEVPAQGSNHSSDLPGDWFRRSLRRWVAAAAMGVLRTLTLEPSLEWLNRRPF